SSSTSVADEDTRTFDHNPSCFMLSSSTTPSPDPKDYRLFELAENVVGEGGYGIVYHGIFDDKT
ncbi:hypothetical protein R6Q59_023644, partial [Mikania micrantha]